MSLIRLFPTYVGSKRYWVDILRPKFQDSNMVEFFCGSSILSLNLAKTCYLNDIDPYVVKIFQNYDKLIIPDSFTIQDYYDKRKEIDWWKYTVIFQRLSFSGTFRHSKNGYNVPIGNTNPSDINLKEIKDDYQHACQRIKELSPIVTCGSYLDIKSSLELQHGIIIDKDFFKDKVAVCDPPFETSKASYNIKYFDYQTYWRVIQKLTKKSRAVILFDREDNLIKQDIPILAIRNMRVCGDKKADKEGLSIFEKGEWLKKL